MFNKKNKKKKGFTLIELVIAVLIIGVIAAISVPMYFRAVEKSRASESISTLGTIAKAQQRHKLQSNEYTDSIGELDITLKDYSEDDVATGHDFDTEYFDFTLLDPTNIAKTQAARKNGEYSLYIDYDTNKITCQAEDTGICQRLGLDLEQGSFSQGGVNTNTNPNFNCNYSDLMSLSPKLLMGSNSNNAFAYCNTTVENGFTKVTLCQTALAVNSQNCQFIYETPNGYTVQSCAVSGTPNINNCAQDNGRFVFQEDSNGNWTSQYCRESHCYYTATYDTGEDGTVYETQSGGGLGTYKAQYSVLPDGTAVQRNCVSDDCSEAWIVTFSQQPDGTLVEETDWFGSVSRKETKTIDDNTTIIGECEDSGPCTSYNRIFKIEIDGEDNLLSITCENPVGLTCPEWD